MAEVTNELTLEVLNQLQARMGTMEAGERDVKQELISIRGPLVSIQTDIHGVYEKLDRREDRMERIERRLELRELAEPSTPFRHE